MSWEPPPPCLLTSVLHATQARILFARILVEVDVTKPIVHKVLVAGPGGMIIDKRLSMTGSRAFARNVK